MIRATWKCGWILGLLLLSAPRTTHAMEGETQVLDSGLTENVKTSLLFIDAEVVDRAGRPRPGLTAEDFIVRLGSKSWPIQSVDDLCGCNGELDDQDSAGAPQSPPPAFILFLDFSHLRPDGRGRSLDEVERWIREVKAPEDRALIVAYSGPAGLRQLCPLTDDPARLSSAIRTAREDPRWNDPFPLDYPRRLERCRTRTVSCHNVAMQEYRSAWNAANALLHFVSRLEAIAGRKVLLFFHQIHTAAPAILYAADRAGRVFFDGGDASTVPELKEIIEEIAGAAVVTGTVIHSITAGVSPDGSRDFNDRLARATGGESNEGGQDLRPILDSAGRGCACMYRIGLAVPKPKRSQVYRVVIGIGQDERLVPTYRLEVLSDSERWARSAGAVLLDPDAARDVTTRVELIPQSVARDGWTVQLRVVLDAGSLSSVPYGGQQEVRWEVGALLARKGGRQHREMLASSRARCPAAGRCGVVVHEATLDSLKPGDWELRAFVRDRWADVFGGARVEIELPDRAEVSVVGPWLSEPERRFLVTPLPARGRGKREPELPPGRIATGALPFLGASAFAGDRLTLRSWICDRRKGDIAPEVSRRLVLEGQPIGHVFPARPTLDGGCWAFVDPIPTAEFPGSSVEYELRIARTGDDVLAAARVDIENGDPATNARQTRPVESAATVVQAAAPGPQESIPVQGEMADAPIVAEDATPAAALEVPSPSTGAPEPVVSAVATPRDAALLRRMLAGLEQIADRYRDEALHFTCEESITYRSKRTERRFEHEYIYAYDDAGKLRDYRVAIAKRPVKEGEPIRPRIIDLNETRLPVYVLRAYSSVFLFADDMQPYYDYAIVDREEEMARSVIIVGLTPRQPYRKGANDWVGRAWIDAETFELLRFEGHKVADRESHRIYEHAIEQSVVRAETGQRARKFDETEVEFGEFRKGIRFPSRVVTRRTTFRVSIHGTHLRSAGTESFEIEQNYDNYRIYSVSASPEGDEP